MIYVDVHAHLTDARFADDLDEVLALLAQKDVAAITAGVDLESSEQALALAQNRENVFAAVGIHPENILDGSRFSNNAGLLDEQTFAMAQRALQEQINKIASLCKQKKVVAIGEIGLDYHFFDGLCAAAVQQRKDLQKLAFVRQIELANSAKLPIVVHSRDAMGDTIEILKNHRTTRPGLLHCYGGSLESAQILMDLGFSFSFGGVVTFKNAKNVQQVVQNLPIQRILLETDSPYLAPEPHRGQRNQPANVIYVAHQIARLKGLTLEEVAKITTQNAKNLFGI